MCSLLRIDDRTAPCRPLRKGNIMRGSVENAFMAIHNPLVDLYQWLISMLPEDDAW